MKSKDGKSQREEKSTRRREKIREEKESEARKGRKVTKHSVFPIICGSGGSKSRLAKAAGAEPSGQMRDEKVHAVAARSTFASEKAKNTPGADHFWKLRCRKSARRCGRNHISKSKCTKHTRSGPLLEVEMSKSARRCGAKHISKSKCTKHFSFGALLEVAMSKKCTPLWREAHFEVKMYKTHQVRTTFRSCDLEKVHAVVARSTFRSQNVRNTTCSLHFWRFICRFAWQEQGIVHLLKKVSKTWGFCGISTNDGRCGTFEGDLQRCIFRGRRSTRDIFSRAVRRSGRWFPERGCILEHQICRFAEMILRDRCSTSYDLASLFRGRRSSLDRWTGKIAKHIGTRPSALHSTFHFWRKSRRIAAFLILSTSKPEDVSQNSFVFKLADRQVDRQTDRQTER